MILLKKRSLLALKTTFPMALGLVVLSTLTLPAAGCKAAPPPSPAKASAPTASYPARPTTPAPPFKVFHTEPASITLVTSLDATDDGVTTIIYQLRDAAHAHTFDALHIPQKLVDARKPVIGFHIYRGPRCAAEKYAPGAPPCGPSYHAAGDYSLGDYTNPIWDDGELLHGDGVQTPLWNPDAPR